MSLIVKSVYVDHTSNTHTSHDTGHRARARIPSPESESGEACHISTYVTSRHAKAKAEPKDKKVSKHKSAHNRSFDMYARTSNLVVYLYVSAQV